MLIGIGSLINKNTFEAALICKGALIGRKVLNRISAVIIKPALSNVIFLKEQYWVLFFSYCTSMTCQIACRILILDWCLMTHILHMLTAI